MYIYVYVSIYRCTGVVFGVVYAHWMRGVMCGVCSVHIDSISRMHHT